MTQQRRLPSQLLSSFFFWGPWHSSESLEDLTGVVEYFGIVQHVAYGQFTNGISLLALLSDYATLRSVREMSLGMISFNLEN